MQKRHLAIAVGLIAAAATTVAPAQQAREGVAQLKAVKGNVLVSRSTGLAAGGEAARVVDHARVITTANSEVTVVFDNGCEVHLTENQRLEVESEKPCAALVAEAQSILVEPAGTALSGGSVVAVIFWTALPALGAGAVGAEILFGPKPSPVGVNPLGPTPLSPS